MVIARKEGGGMGSRRGQRREQREEKRKEIRAFLFISSSGQNCTGTETPVYK